MTLNTNYKNSPNIYRRLRKGNSRSPHSLGPIPKPTGFTNYWAGMNDLPLEPDLKKILFLSKRGMTRSPIAREVMRSLLEKTDFAGEVVVLSAGVTKAYDDCPIDKRTQGFCNVLGYRLQTNSRFANPSLLRQADLVITLDHESENFSKVRKLAIHGLTRPLGIFMAPGCEPFLPDPFDREEDQSVEECFDEIISSIEYGCSKLLSNLPSLIS